MGLLQAGVGALSGVLADSWREYFYCDALDTNILVAKGEKRESKRSANKRGSENVISDGSILCVADGQCMLVVEQGKVVELCAQPGEYVFDYSTEPSIFYGELNKESILENLKVVGKRFTFGGEPPKDQRVYYFNTKEIPGNRYGTANPVPFRVVDKNIGLDIDIAIRCNGEYSYKIVDPLLFYSNVCGNVEYEYDRSQIDSQLKTELMTALQPAFAKISEMGIRYSALPGHAMELADALNDVLSKKWSALRGIKVWSFGVNSVTASKEDEDMIKQLQRSAVMRDPTMAAATLVGAQSEAMKAAAANPNAGPMMAFAGMNMAQNAGGMNAQNLFAMGQQTEKAQTPPSPGWTCACGAVNSGKFCVECGKPQTAGWSCACGHVNKGKFCSECGAPKPADAPLYRCDKCGWEPADPKNPPRFCPECGDVFDESDKK